jgi:hypothetical protein
MDKVKNITLNLFVGLFQFINLESSMPIVGGKRIPYHSLVADVIFNSVTFAYPTRPQQVSPGNRVCSRADCNIVYLIWSLAFSDISPCSVMDGYQYFE